MFISTISHTKSETLKQCLYKYARSYIDYIRIEAPNQDSLNFGSYIHKIFEVGYKETSLRSLSSIAENLKKTYKIPKSQKKRTDKCLKNFLRFNSKLENTVGAELKFEVVLEDGITSNGIIDRVIKGKDGGFLVIDYKTGKREKSKLDLYNDRQLQGYAYAINQMYKIPVSKITCAHYYPLTGNLVTAKYNSSQIGSFKREKINEVWKIRKLKKHQFPPTTNEFCNWCSVKGLCPLEVGPVSAKCRLDEEQKKAKKKRKAPKGNT